MLNIEFLCKDMKDFNKARNNPNNQLLFAIILLLKWFLEYFWEWCFEFVFLTCGWMNEAKSVSMEAESAQ